ncbi:MAG: rod shape-determining protein RodA [Solirubrobacterales bacterium]|nr:rod shape-determining protein RodA [Solirubrobacterales bacterium]
MATTVKPTLMAVTAPEEAPAERAHAVRLPLDPLLVAAVVGLGVCSVLTLKQATRGAIPGDPSYYTNRQIIYLVVGAVAMVAISRFDYTRLKGWRNGIYGALIFIILAVLGLGHSVNGSQRAISLPLFSFQASELGKVLLIVALAAFVASRTRVVRSWGTVWRTMAVALLPAMLVVAQPDLGSGLVYIAVAVTVLFVAGARWSHMAVLLATGALALGGVLVAAPAAGVHVLKSYQEERLTAFLHPSANSQKQGYQQVESKIAIGAGQTNGRGANATQIPYKFVPESETDFIFAAVGEQWGFAGAALVLSLYALLIWRTLSIAASSRDRFGSLVASGVAAMLMFQVFVNVGMAIGIMPITGVTLPLMSYGGSSVIATLLAVGLLQAIYFRARAAETPLKGRAARNER